MRDCFNLKKKLLLKRISYFFLSKISIFNVLKSNIQSLLNYKRNVSWKFEVLSSKMKEKIYFYNFFKFPRKLKPKSLRSICLYQKLFIKITISYKLNKIILFYKNWLAVCTSSFHIRCYVIFSKKISDSPCTLNIFFTILLIFIYFPHLLQVKQT